METYVLGIDPGRTSGVCILRTHEPDRGFDVVKSYEISWSSRFEFLPLISSLALQCQPPQRLAIVIESFRLYPHRARQQIGSAFPSVQIIGIVETAAFIAGVLDTIVYQPSSNISRVEVLHPVGVSPHVQDAYKHARYYYETCSDDINSQL